MRKLSVLLASAFAVGALFAGPAFAGHDDDAEPSAACGTEPVATTDSSVTVCVTGTGVADGNVTASQEESGGYIVADGDSTNSAANVCLDGFVGVQVHDGSPTVVAESEGDYHFPHTATGDPDPSQCLPA